MKLIATCVAIAALATLHAHATEGEGKQGSQQSKFAACAHESKGLRGDEHQKFMSDCLKGGEEGAARKEASHRAAGEGTSQQNRMRACNEEAARKDLHGDERRAFMSTCLKG